MEGIHIVNNKSKSYILISQNVAFNLGFCYKKDVAVNACIFIQTKEKSPNANCVQTQPGGFALQKRYPVQNENPGSA